MVGRGRFKLVLIAGVPLVVLAGFFFYLRQGYPPVRADSVLHEPIFLRPDSVRLRRLVRFDEEHGDPKYFMMVASPSTTPLAIDKAEELLRILAMPTRSEINACYPHPGFELEFVKGSQSGRVLVCLECGEFCALTKGNPDWDNWTDMEEVQSEVVAWAKDAFPNDQAIQELKNR